MKNKLILLLLLFLLLIPLILPISILFIKFFEWLINITTSDHIPDYTLAANIIVSKIIYNISICVYFIYNIETLSREKLKRKPKQYNEETTCYWWTLSISIILLIFIIIDAISVNEIFFK